MDARKYTELNNKRLNGYPEKVEAWTGQATGCLVSDCRSNEWIRLYKISAFIRESRTKLCESPCGLLLATVRQIWARGVYKRFGAHSLPFNRTPGPFMSQRCAGIAFDKSTHHQAGQVIRASELAVWFRMYMCMTPSTSIDRAFPRVWWIKIMHPCTRRLSISLLLLLLYLLYPSCTWFTLILRDEATRKLHTHFGRSFAILLSNPSCTHMRVLYSQIVQNINRI